MFLTRKAPAKLNLGLHVLRKRIDGYHDLETVFVRIAWSDTITVGASDELVFTVDNPTLRAEEGNLCLLAAQKLLETVGASHGAAIHLEKRIPMGAGLGGGSSDAASTLEVLNEIWQLGLEMQELRSIGATIGSDVPVFLHETPAYATGRGEILETLTDDTGGKLEIPFWFAVLKPDAHVSTGEAYGSIEPNDIDLPDLREIIRSLDLDRWRRELVNDFERPIVARHPEIGSAIRLLEESGAGYAAMSGSGSAVFGVFEEEGTAVDAAVKGREQGLTAWSGRSMVDGR